MQPIELEQRWAPARDSSLTNNIINHINNHIREGFKNKKNKKYGIFHNRAGGVYPIPHFFFIYFLTVKWQFSVKFEVFFLVFCLQIKPLIPSYSIPVLSNPINLKTIIPPFPLSEMLWIMSKKQRKFVPWMLKKNHK